jgi:hypothetical protein
LQPIKKTGSQERIQIFRMAKRWGGGGGKTNDQKGVGGEEWPEVWWGRGMANEGRGRGMA